MLTAAVVDRTAVAVAIDTVTYYYGGRHRRTFTNKTNFVLRVEVILAKCRRRSMYRQNPTPALGEVHNRSLYRSDLVSICYRYDVSYTHQLPRLQFP